MPFGRHQTTPSTKDLVAAIRANMAWFDYPLDDLTDDELARCCAHLGSLTGYHGLTVKDAARAVRLASRWVRPAPKRPWWRRAIRWLGQPV